MDMYNKGTPHLFNHFINGWRLLPTRLQRSCQDRMVPFQSWCVYDEITIFIRLGFEPWLALSKPAPNHRKVVPSTSQFIYHFHPRRDTANALRSRTGLRFGTCELQCDLSALQSSMVSVGFRKWRLYNIILGRGWTDLWLFNHFVIYFVSFKFLDVLRICLLYFPTLDHLCQKTWKWLCAMDFITDSQVLDPASIFCWV